MGWVAFLTHRAGILPYSTMTRKVKAHDVRDRFRYLHQYLVHVPDCGRELSNEGWFMYLNWWA